MSCNYSDYAGEMCGKCIYMNLRDKHSFASDRYNCEQDQGYQAWSSRPCGRYTPDNSDSRIEEIEQAREGRFY